MSSLRDQLLGLGFKAAPKPQNKAAAKAQKAVKPAKPKQPAHSPKSREEMDLARAYAMRAQQEKEERLEAERQKQEQARLRREARNKLAALLSADKVLNLADADIARHFEYGGKIKRVYVSAEQLKALNAGELGVVQHNGRYLLVSAATLAEAEAVFADAIAFKVNPDSPAEDDPYSDPKYQIPDDLVW
ncbi:nucleoprotein/polynucleotide-associated enzyme [Lysobacteraceae bacterium NML07-0707]|nr:nucleoprotein/polynucleotide-associated enzyme [Xanthomonadaceae bacterium NML07-0707]